MKGFPWWCVHLLFTIISLIHRFANVSGISTQQILDVGTARTQSVAFYSHMSRLTIPSKDMAVEYTWVMWYDTTERQTMIFILTVCHVDSSKTCNILALILLGECMTTSFAICGTLLVSVLTRSNVWLGTSLFRPRWPVFGKQSEDCSCVHLCSQATDLPSSLPIDFCNLAATSIASSYWKRKASCRIAVLEYVLACVESIGLNRMWRFTMMFAVALIWRVSSSDTWAIATLFSVLAES